MKEAGKASRKTNFPGTKSKPWKSGGGAEKGRAGAGSSSAAEAQFISGTPSHFSGPGGRRQRTAPVPALNAQGGGRFGQVGSLQHAEGGPASRGGSDWRRPSSKFSPCDPGSRGLHQARHCRRLRGSEHDVVSSDRQRRRGRGGQPGGRAAVRGGCRPVHGHQRCAGFRGVGARRLPRTQERLEKAPAGPLGL